MGHAWGMDQRTTAGAWGLSRTVQSRYLCGEMLSTQPLSIDSFFLTRNRSQELRLGITVETTENREGRAKLGKPRYARSALGPCHNGRARAWAVTNGRPRFGGTAGRWPCNSRSWEDAEGRFGLWSRRSSTVALNSPVNGLGSSTVNVATPGALTVHEVRPGLVRATCQGDSGRLHRCCWWRGSFGCSCTAASSAPTARISARCAWWSPSRRQTSPPT